MKIIKAAEAIAVEHPVFLVFGQPGIGKSTLGYSTKEPLLLDFDKGAHRAANRRDSLLIDTWADITELMAHPAALAEYAALTVDTVGRCLDLLTVDIIEHEPKKGVGGNLTQQGWGTLKTRFRTWIAALRVLGKDVLLLAHDKEDKDGDLRIVRPDIVGGSYSEVMKVADFIGYCYMSGRDRILDFSPTDRWIGKNPAGWLPFRLPPVEQAQRVLADLFDRGRAALGAISEVSISASHQVEEWKTAINYFVTADECTQALHEITKLSPIVAAQVKRLLFERSKTLQCLYNKQTRAFVGPSTKLLADQVTADAIPFSGHSMGPRQGR